MSTPSTPSSPAAPKKTSLLKKILLGLVVVIVGFAIVVAVQPAEYRVTRTATMAAPAPAVFAQVNELKKWEAWSPWAKLNPAMKNTYEGPPAGTGAVFSWAGNNDVGEGRMTITESRANELVRFKLEFFKPMSGKSDAEWTFKPEGNQTTVTWSMSGNKSFICKAFCLFMNMDRMVGGEFEQGLASLRSIVEAPPKS